MSPRRRTRAAAVVFALVVILVLVSRSRSDPATSATHSATAGAVAPPAAVVVAPASLRLTTPDSAPPRSRPTAPSATPPASSPEQAGTRPPSDPALFGPLVTLGQGFSLGEALSKNAALADQYVEKLCDEARKLRERPPLPEPATHDKDAAQFMAPLIDYEAPLDQPPGKLHVADELRQRVGATGSDWMVKITDRDLAGLDFTWLQALAQFDHWTLLSAGRLREIRSENIFRDPIPNYLSLMVWSKLRLALGLRRGDLQAASAEVRHLADLIRSQQILIAEAVAVAIYKLDARGRDVAAASGADVSGWPPIGVDQLDRERSTAFASIYFTYPGVRPETVRKAIGCAPAPCVALSEGAGANRSFGAYGATDNSQLLRELAASHHCETALIDRQINAGELQVSEALESAGAFEDRIPELLGTPR